MMAVISAPNSLSLSEMCSRANTLTPAFSTCLLNISVSPCPYWVLSSTTTTVFAFNFSTVKVAALAAWIGSVHMMR